MRAAVSPAAYIIRAPLHQSVKGVAHADGC